MEKLRTEDVFKRLCKAEKKWGVILILEKGTTAIKEEYVLFDTWRKANAYYETCEDFDPKKGETFDLTLVNSKGEMHAALCAGG